MSDVRRQAEHEVVMAAIHPKPKPVKAKRPKRKRTNPRKELENQVEAALREVIAWRDGPECIEHGIDGCRCGNGLQWGHLIARHASPWLKYDLCTFVQCGNHNLLHDHDDPMMTRWFLREFGQTAYDAICEEQRTHVGQKPSM